jgi:hypothetical protein
MKELAYKIDLEYPKTIKWHEMSADEKACIKNRGLLFGNEEPKPVVWGKYLNRWVSSWACQAMLPCGWVYRCTLRNGKTFDYLVVEEGK